jgi:glutathione S-transferase
MGTPKLYEWKRSGNGYKVRLLAALLDIELELIEIDHHNEQHHSPDFLELNPRGQVPVLVDGEKSFTDSAAILVYLAGLHSDPGNSQKPSSFWSEDSAEQAAIVDWLAFAASWIQAGIATARSIINFKPKNDSMTDQVMLASATAKGHRSLEILETVLLKNKWLTLDRPTIADIAVFSYVALASTANISLDSYPAVNAWVSRVRKLPGFIPSDG